MGGTDPVAANIKLSTFKDFRGGMNLRADQFELSPNESPDLLNVDIDPRGGVEQRNGLTLLPATVANPNLISDDDSTAYATVLGSTGNATKTRQSAGFKSAHAAIRLAVTAAGQAFYQSNYVGAGAVAGRFPVAANTLYSGMSFAQHVSGTAVPCFLRIDWYNGAGTYISSISGAEQTPLAPPSYNAYTVQGTSPATAVTAQIVWFIGNGTTNPAAAYTVDLSELQISAGYNTELWISPDFTSTSSLVGIVTLFGRYVGGYNHLFALAGGALWYSVPGTNSWTVLDGRAAVTAFIQFKGDFIITQGGFGPGPAYKWNGVTYTLMGVGFNENLAAPTGLNVPQHVLTAVFQGCVWLAKIQEGATQYLNRVRWSHPNQPFDYRSVDYIDIDTGLDGDTIKALVPFEDKLLVFKSNSIYVITGTSPDTFQVFPLSRTLGAANSAAVVATDLGVYFYHAGLGVFVYDGKSIRWQFERIYPLITDGLVPLASAAATVCLGWSGRRLWLSVPWRASLADAIPYWNTRTFVMDPTLSKEGSWTAYSTAVGGFFELVVNAQSTKMIGGAATIAAGSGRITVLEDPTAPPQPYDALAVTTHISSYYVTPWFDGGQPALKKRWARPEFIVRSLNADSNIPVEVRFDWDSQVIRRTFSLATNVDQNTMIWGDPWGEKWAGGDANSPRSEHHAGPSMGQSRAVQLKIAGPVDNKHWGLNALTVKFVPKPPRS